MVSPTYNKLLETLRAVAESMCTLTSSLRISESISHSRLLGCATALPRINRTEDTPLSKGSLNLPLLEVSSIYLKHWNLEPGATSYLSEQCSGYKAEKQDGCVRCLYRYRPALRVNSTVCYSLHVKAAQRVYICTILSV